MWVLSSGHEFKILREMMAYPSGVRVALLCCRGKMWRGGVSRRRGPVEKTSQLRRLKVGLASFGGVSVGKETALARSGGITAGLCTDGRWVWRKVGDKGGAGSSECRPSPQI